MHKEKMRVVYVEPGKWAKITEIGKELEDMQEAVGGLIQSCYFFDDPVALICNDEGKLLRLPANRAIYKGNTKEIIDIIAGPFFICYTPPDSDSFESLPEELAEKYREKFLYPQLILNTSEGLIVV